MNLHVIHNNNNKERSERLKYELERQTIQPKVIYHDAVYMNRPYQGISQAHRNIVALAKANELEEVWICEDDIRIPAKDGFDYFLANKPKEFDIYLGGIYQGSIINGLVKVFSGLHCYIVHSRFYDEFLKTDPNKHIDRALGFRGIYKVCYPFAAIQYNGLSENTGKLEDYDKYLKGRKIHGMDSI